MVYHFGLLAQDIHKSVTPRAYGAYSEDIDIQSTFALHNIEPSQLPETAEHLRQTMNGFTVTMPYKKVFMDYCDELDESAIKCGSTNTVLVRDGKMIGYNTDGWGLIKALDLKGISVTGRRVVMVGAGGVAGSIAYQLSVNGATRVDVFNPVAEETARLCATYPALCFPHDMDWAELAQCCDGADLYLNASVLGQVGFPDYEDCSFLTKLAPGAVLYDVNYSNDQAKLVPAAKGYGIPAFVGRSMSACQGVRAMEIWTGRTPSDGCAAMLVAELEGAT